MSAPQKRSLWGVAAAVLAAGGAMAGILSFPFQVGLLHVGNRKEAPSLNPPASPPGTTLPSPEERAAWNHAIANRRDCDSIRRYLLDYPAGQFVNAAQTILSARRETAETKWIRFDFPSNVVAVSSLDNRTSREIACASARAQMTANMTAGCDVFADQSATYRAIRVVPPRESTCECRDEAIQLAGQPTPALWRCTTRAVYSCRGEQLVRVKRFACD